MAKIKLRWKYAEGDFDTKDLELIDLPAREVKFEKDATISIQTRTESGQPGWNLAIMEVQLGDRESSNILAKEIVRRFNEFPKEQKQ